MRYVWPQFRAVPLPKCLSPSRLLLTVPGAHDVVCSISARFSIPIPRPSLNGQCNLLPSQHTTKQFVREMTFARDAKAWEIGDKSGKQFLFSRSNVLLEAFLRCRIQLLGTFCPDMDLMPLYEKQAISKNPDGIYTALRAAAAV